MKQVQLQTYDLIRLINNSGIEYCVIKGIVMQSYYNQPHYRYMGDLDIWVQMRDMDRTLDIFKNVGYILTHLEGQHKHAVLKKQNAVNIEVHFGLVEPWSIYQHKKINEEYWKQREEILIDGLKVVSLNLKTHYRYLILHLVAHMCFSGFGIKQLLDLVLLVNSNRIDPMDFLDYFDSLGYGVFYRNIIAVCVEYLGMKLDYKLYFEVDFYVINDLLENIIRSGSFGNHSEELRLETTAHYRLNTWYKEKKLPLWWYSLFPCKDELGFRYSYAKKNIILLPIAWSHRFFRGFIKRNISLSGKISYLTASCKQDDRDYLLKKLELEIPNTTIGRSKSIV